MQELHTDIAIIGGGIAGLWTLNQLRDAGYNAVLFEQRNLGSDQTIASQGMIHGGVKYALAGALNSGSQAISEMPKQWQQCLAGEGPVDLRGTKVLSKDFYLWSNASLGSRFTSFFASKMMRGRVQKLRSEQFPIPLRNPAFSGQVYRLVDLVLDVPSLVNTLAQRHRSAIFNIDWNTAELQQSAGVASIQLPNARLNSNCLLLTAGAGNETLIKQLGGTGPAMQRRPLQQVLVKHEYKESLYAHCMGNNPSPRLTISSHTSNAGEPVWYLGGDLATEGVNDAAEVLIVKAQKELAQLFPWINFGRCEWRVMKVDRAEPKQSRLLKPDQAFVGPVGGLNNVLTAWPTKLTLCPDLGNQIQSALNARGVAPRQTTHLPPQLAELGFPEIAPAAWNTLF